jgi:Ribbon-helix-helix protein, copG family.
MSQEAKHLLEKLSEKLGVSQSAIIEISIRQLAKKEKVEYVPKTK